MQHTIDQQELRTLTNKAAIMPLTQAEQRQLQNLIDTAEGHANADPETKYNRAFRRFLSVGPGLSQFSFDRADGRGKNILSVAERSILRAREISASNVYLDSESRDMSESSGPLAPTSVATMGGAYSGSTSGFFSSVEFNAQVTSALRTYGGVLSEATILDDTTGRIRAFPVDDDTAVSGELVKEGQQTTQQDIAGIGQVLVGAFRFSSKIVKISRELCEDSGIDLQSYLAERLGIRLARTMNDRFTNGTGEGNGEPLGLLNSAQISVLAQGSSSNTGGSETGSSIGSDDLVALEKSLEPSYRKGAKFMLASDTLSVLKATKNKVGQPLWASGLSTGGQDSLMGYPVVINNQMPALSANPTPNSPPIIALRSIAFGQFSKYVIKRAPMVVYLLLERFALEGVVGYLCLQRADGRLLDINAVKILGNVY
jgi:HK97 family phage major capsid protein